MVRQIAADLRSDGQYIVGIDGDNVEEVKRVRALGRKAGRQLGWKIRTYASDPERRDDHRSVVIVYVDESNPLHEELMRMRSEKRMRAAFDSLDLGIEN